MFCSAAVLLSCVFVAGVSGSPDQATDLEARARVLNENGKHNEALPLFERCLELKTQKWGRNHYETTGPLLGLASILNKKGEFSAARAIYEQCLDTLENTLGPDHRRTADAAVGLAVCLGNLGDYAGAESILRRHLEAVVEAHGELNSETGNLMLSLAEVLSMLGQQVESTQLYRRAAEIMEEVHGPEHVRTAAALSGLAHIERRMGNSPNAGILYRRCIEIVERLHGDLHPDLIHYRCRLGMCLFERHKFDEAIESIERGIADAATIYGTDSYQVAIEERRLGLILDYVGRRDEAYSVLHKSLVTLEDYFGPDHPSLSTCLKGLASVSYKLGLMVEAHAYNNRAVSIHQRFGRADQMELSYLLNYKSLFELHLQQWDAAVTTAFQATEVSLSMLEDIYQVTSTREALLYATRPQACISGLVTASVANPGLSNSASARVFSMVARTHGQVLDRLAERQRFLDLVEDTTGVTQTRMAFAKATQRVADLAVRGPENDRKSYNNKLSQARLDQEKAERALSAAGENLRLSVRLPGSVQEVSAGALSDALPPGATLIHFVRFGKWLAPEERRGNPKLSYYGAFCLRRLDPHSWDLEFVELASAALLDSLIFAYRKSIDGIDLSRRPSPREEAEFRSVAYQLYEKVWAPLQLRAGSADTARVTTDSAPTVFIVPVSWLHLLDFNTLIAPSGELVIERWKLHLLSSARDLLRPPSQNRRGAGMLAVGNPTSTSQDPQRNAQEPAEKSRLPAFLCAEAYYAPVPLPGAEKEARLVAEYFSAATNESTTVLLGPQGTEEVVKRLLVGKRMVHFATHGFFCDEDERKTFPSAERLVDPLLMSGLVLAADSDEDDGLLTAQEVIGLDLRNLDWVVLSACGSGLGRVLWGEGLFGLNRAFEIAGARTVVTALWRVNDSVMQELMEKIYRMRLAGSSTIDSIREPQLQRLRDQRLRLNRIHPSLWGGIIAQGDWR